MGNFILFEGNKSFLIKKWPKNTLKLELAKMSISNTNSVFN